MAAKNQDNGGSVGVAEKPQTDAPANPAETPTTAETHGQNRAAVHKVAQEAAERIALSLQPGKSDSDAVNQAKLCRTVYQSLYANRVGELQGMRVGGADALDIHNAAVDYLAAHGEEIDQLAAAIKRAAADLRVVNVHDSKFKGDASPLAVAQTYSDAKMSKKDRDTVTYKGIMGKTEAK